MSTEKKHYFFDVHLHSFNLSHAGILSFLNRFFLENTLSFNELLNGNVVEIILKIIFKKRPRSKFSSALLWCVRYFIFILLILISPLLIFVYLFKNLILQRKKFSQSISNTINVLSIFENDLGRQFRYLELDFLSLIPEIKNIIDHYSGKETEERENAPEFYDLIISELNKQGNAFPMSGSKYHKAIITPLIMDFKYKGFEGLDKEKVYYNLPPRKSVIDQCVDIFEGIKEYLFVSKLKLLEIYPFLGINPANYDIEPYVTLSGTMNPDLIEGLSNHFYFIRHNNILIHYRCLQATEQGRKAGRQLMELLKKQAVSSGLLEKEDDIERIKRLIEQLNDLYKTGLEDTNSRVVRDDGLFEQNMLVKMMLKYFSEYDHPGLEDFRQKNPFFADAAQYAQPRSFWDVRSFFFSGIKVYPPLGFHPWPEHDEQAFTMTNFLYQFCEDRGIPITTHCSDGGFKVIAENIQTDKDIASPNHWKNALEAYNKLILNFAHFGNQGSYTKKRWGDWTSTILSLILDTRFTNVYADISDIGVAKGRYAQLLKSIEQYWKNNHKDLKNKEIDFGSFCVQIENHVLFGTDFMMNLFHSRSNLEYLQIFDTSEAFRIDGEQQYVFDKNKLCSENPERFLFG